MQIHIPRLNLGFFFDPDIYLKIAQVGFKGDDQEGDILGMGDLMVFTDNDGGGGHVDIQPFIHEFIPGIADDNIGEFTDGIFDIIIKFF
jgi:hypothetical protein